MYTKLPDLKQISDVCLSHCRFNNWLDPVPTGSNRETIPRTYAEKWTETKVFFKFSDQISHFLWAIAVVCSFWILKVFYSHRCPQENYQINACHFYVDLLWYFFPRRNISLLPGIQSCISEHQKFYSSLPALVAESKNREEGVWNALTENVTPLLPLPIFYFSMIFVYIYIFNFFVCYALHI